jgi:hypothetical protein
LVSGISTDLPSDKEFLPFLVAVGLTVDASVDAASGCHACWSHTRKTEFWGRAQNFPGRVVGPLRVFKIPQVVVHPFCIAKMQRDGHADDVVIIHASWMWWLNQTKGLVKFVNVGKDVIT